MSGRNDEVTTMIHNEGVPCFMFHVSGRGKADVWPNHTVLNAKLCLWCIGARVGHPFTDPIPVPEVEVGHSPSSTSC